MEQIRKDALRSFFTAFFVVTFLIVVVLFALSTTYGAAAGYLFYLIPALLSGVIAWMHTYHVGRIALLEDRLKALESLGSPTGGAVSPTG